MYIEIGENMHIEVGFRYGWTLVEVQTNVPKVNSLTVLGPPYLKMAYGSAYRQIQPLRIRPTVKLTVEFGANV